jgi:cytochrome oxidase assembly protein ShyY1
MPEIWIDKENKKRFLYWENQDESDKFQILVLKKVCDSLGLDLEKAIKIRLDYIANGKKLKLKRKDVMIQEKNAAG